jgi:TRAP-type transport system small permease protein
LGARLAKKSPLLPLYERGKCNPSPPLCKGETEGILERLLARFLRKEKMTILCRFIAKGLEYVVGGLFIVIAATALAQVFTRYVLSNSLTWTHELDILLMIWAVWLGAIGIHRKAHLRISILSDRLSERTQKIILFVLDVLTLVFLVILGWKGIAVIESVEGTVLTSMDLPRGFVVSAAPVGATFMILFFLPILFIDLRSLLSKKGLRS